MRFWVEKHREIFTDRPKSSREHRLWGLANDHPITLLDLPPKELVANCATDQIDLHLALNSNVIDSRRPF
jgi:hypothetical protein